MANHALPTTDSSYVDYTAELKARDEDAARQFDPAYTSPTNVLTHTYRLNSAAAKWQRWNGTSWVDAVAVYAINISGNAGTATKLATARTIGGVSFDGTANIDLPGVNTTGDQNTTGNAATVTNGVYTVGNQTITGVKTFSDNVGIGTTSPTSKLDVTGAFVNRSNSDGYLYFGTLNGANPFGSNYDRFEMRIDPSSQVFNMGTSRGGTGQPRALAFLTDGVEHIRLLTNGNLGVGTAIPVAKMHVNGNVAVADDSVVQDTVNYGSFGVTRTATGSNTKSYYALTRSGNSVWSLGISSDNSFVIGQPNTSKEITSESLRINSAGKLILSAANQGIQFADGTTQTTASSAGYYEPTIGATTSNFTGTREGWFYYTKVGNIVTVTGRFSLTKRVAGIASGDITITVPVSGRNTFAPVRGVLTTEASTYVSASPAYYGIPVILIIGTSTGSTVDIRVDAVAGYQFSSWFVDVSFSYPLI